MSQTQCPKCGTPSSVGRQVCERCGTRLAALRAPGQGQRAQARPGEGGFQRGRVVASRYALLDMIGRGGMGCIYKVHDNTLNEEVALKTLLPKFTNDRVVVDRFFNEARIARQLSHPNIVRVHDIGMADNAIYISMEYVKGQSLRSILDALPAGARLPIAQVLRIMVQLCAALQYAHRYTVHRDIKPENVMVCEDGTVKLMDFGISKLMTSTSMTSAEMIMGTPKYMSPEQLKDSSRVDARADIYSLGVMLYEILTGGVPTGIPKPASQITYGTPPAIDPIVARCLETDPIDRYQSADQLKADLDAILQAATSDSMEIRSLNSQTPPAKERGGGGRRVVGLLLAVLIMALMGFAVWRLDLSRQAALLEASQEQEQSGDAGSVEAPSNTFDVRFTELDQRVSAARDKAEKWMADMAVGDTPTVIDPLASGDAFREKAQAMAAKEDPEAFDQGWYALQCYLGPVICPDGMAFVPPGEITMRDPSGEVTVWVEGFFIDVAEVTNGQFLAFAGDPAGSWPFPPELEASRQLDGFDAMPVTYVTFYDALAYAAWAGRSLPTEAQWARAAFGDGGSRFPWGDEWDATLSSCLTTREQFAMPAPARSFESDLTPLGCYDMAGNVSEWTRTGYSALSSGDSVGRDDAQGFTFGDVLVVRGGCWTDDGEVDLSARRSAPFATASPALGFRCVMEFPSAFVEVDEYLK